MDFRVSKPLGCVLLVGLLFGPGIFATYFSGSLIWLFAMPLATIVGLFVLANSLPKRNLTPDQFADELERRLSKLGDTMNLDDVLSISVADERLGRVLTQLRELEYAPMEKQTEELKSAIAAIRRGDLPEVVTPTILTYRDR